MKPSERIKEIENENADKNSVWVDRFSALIQYLDEEYEKKKEADDEFKKSVLESVWVSRL